MNRKELFQKVARQFIPNIGTILLVLALLWVRDAQALAALTAKSTTTISYQGRLANSSGTPVTSAGLGMTFRLYNTTTGGSALWTETYPGVAVNDGLFHVLLGSVTPLDASYFSTYDTLYLGITVGTDAEMTPREQLASAPYAIQAGRALTVPDGSITTAKIADGAIGTNQIIDNSITSSKLNVRVPKLLGYKTCDGCGNVTEPLIVGWNPVKGANSQDIIETTVTTDGGPVLVQTTSRRGMDPAGASYCYIGIIKDGSRIRGAHMEGISLSTSDWICSGAYLFTGLPAGTYTFQILMWSNSVTTVTWHFERQIVVYQY
jgi:hypothetical protein